MRPFQINIVLVNTLYETNIGASSRAMANMGAERLILIGPQTEITLKAHQAAANGQSGLENRTVYANWQKFFESEPDGIRISLTAKDGKCRLVEDLETSLKYLKEQHPVLTDPELASETLQLYLIFGREDWGLSAEDIEYTHYACSLPTYGDLTSLNLAQAVLLSLFIVRSTWGGQRARLEGHTATRYVRREKPFPTQALQTWIQEMGFDIEDRKMNAFSVLQRMLLHSIPNAKELRILETVLHQGIRKLREYNQLRAQMGLPFIEPKASANPELKVSSSLADNVTE